VLRPPQCSAYSSAKSGTRPIAPTRADLGSAVGKSRLLCEGLWGRAFLTAYNSANDGERLRMAEGLGQGRGARLAGGADGRGLHLHAGPVLAYLVQLPRPARSDKRPAYPPLRRRRDACPHARDGKSSQVCPALGRYSAPHDTVRNALSHLVVQNGVTDAAVVETRLTAADGSTFDAAVVFFDPSSRARVILEVSIVAIGSDTSQLGWRESTRSSERVRRTRAIIASSRGCSTRREIIIFSPPSLCQPVELWAPQW